MIVAISFSEHGSENSLPKKKKEWLTISWGYTGYSPFFRPSHICWILPFPSKVRGSQPRPSNAAGASKCPRNSQTSKKLQQQLLEMMVGWWTGLTRKSTGTPHISLEKTIVSCRFSRLNSSEMMGDDGRRWSSNVGSKTQNSIHVWHLVDSTPEIGGHSKPSHIRLNI